MNQQENKNSEQTQNFTPPKHWVGMQELDASYWNDPKIQEKRGQEFFEKPVEWMEFVEKTDKQGLARRDFLTVMGASMAMATFACARRPVDKIIPYVVKPEEITPGVATWYASTCKECSTGCGVLIKNREGRPVKLEGNPDHPTNHGHLCARGQASLLNLYDTDRLKSPVMRSRADGVEKAIEWKDADAQIVQRLKQASANGKKIRILTGRIESPATLRLVQEFLNTYKGAEHVEFEPLDLEEIAQAQEQAYGNRVIPQYHFDKADVIVSLGADFLGTWISPVEFNRAWSKKRKPESGMSKMYCFEPTMTVTGANADERFAVRSGDEFKIAMALAYEIVVTQKQTSYAGNAAVTSVLSGYKPEVVAEEIGMENGAAKIKAVAHDLWKAKGKSLVVGGGIASRTRDAVNLQLAINFLNSVLENDGATVDGTHNYREFNRGGFASMAKLIEDMKAGSVDVLVIRGSNPSYMLPRNVLGLEDALRKVPLIVSVSDRVDETSKYADLVLPDHHYLENWGDASPKKALYSLQQPALAPIHSSRAFQDSLLAWGKGSMATQAGSWHEYLKNHWKETVYKEYKVAGNYDEFWEGVLRKGVFDGRSPQAKSGAKGTARSFKVGAFPQTKFTSNRSQELTLALYAKVSMYDGRSANNAWLQEMPDPISSVTWDNYLNVSPVLAKKLNLQEDDVVEVASGTVSAHLPVHVQPGMHPGAVSMAVGYGRRSVGKIGDQAGVDVFPFVQFADQKLMFSGQSVTVKKTQKFYRLAATQWHSVTENRPVINDITLAEFKKDPHTGNETDPELRLHTVPSMWPKHKYTGYRWGMAIDLNACTGCGACVVACQVENNVPVVGRDQVRVSRNMHWLRLDRYYSGSPDNPDVVFQPMLCQHCENAPCETVCPVLATVHDDEGLNVQVYNRCVGTRYCQNNCPYKVRRFNFFDHWKAYEGTMNLAWNPDITVRTRGVMEKCTFCVQRIHEVKDRAKDHGEKVRDGDLKTACQQTCPNDAIVFGDVNDPNTRVSKLRSDPRTFRVLEALNARPMIDYMTKVRNKEGKQGGEGHVHHT